MSKIETDKVREIAGQPEKYFQDYQLTVEKVDKSGAVYHGKPVPFLYVPKIFTSQDICRFGKAMQELFKIVDHTIDLYMKHASIRALFGFDKRLEELILSTANGHGYRVNVPMGRFDIFYYQDGGYKFCELNTDGTSAMNEEVELTAVLLSSLPMCEVARDHTVKNFELFDSWVEEVNNIYNEYRVSNHKIPLDCSRREAYENTTVAILDFKDKGNLLEFDIFKKHFEKAGFRCVIADPRDLMYNDGRLFYEGQEIDIIYRRLVTKDLMDRYDEIPALIQGLLANKTCVIGPIKSQIIHTKRFFEVLYQSTFRKFLSEEEIAYIDEHVPMTKLLENNEDLNVYLATKDNYIVKPIDNYASTGVCAGKDYTQEEWESLLWEKMREHYIIQEYCPLALSENVLYGQDGKAELYNFHNLTGLYVYNQKFSGIYSRASRNAIISARHNSYTMSSVYVE
ncbi:MAG TPA: glutathionylspermidine synthase family protein [Desulfitobacteriaceae bacterium]|nr:glutathionylspermidine synthase family protein [Desulfitobacteriaceae bacterium]